MILKNQTVVFTGTLQSMSRKQAQGFVCSLGGRCQSTVTKKTTLLVCGHYSKSLFDNEDYTIKERTARELIHSGTDLQIISEQTFYNLATNQLKQISSNLGVTSS